MLNDSYPLFEEVLNRNLGNRSAEDVKFEEQVLKDGVEYAGTRVAEVFKSRLNPSKELINQFILEELDAMRYGDGTAKSFTRSCGIPEREFVGAMDKTSWVGNPSELEKMQIFVRTFFSRISDNVIRSKFLIQIVDNIMKLYKVGKYNNIQILNNLNLKHKTLTPLDSSNQSAFNNSELEEKRKMLKYVDKMLKESAEQERMQLNQKKKEYAINGAMFGVVLGMFGLMGMSYITNMDAKEFGENIAVSTLSISTFLSAYIGYNIPD